MTFYTYGYLTTRHQTWQYARLILIIVLLALFIWLFVYYLRHRWNVKYKDLSIITGTVILLVLGLQLNGLDNASVVQNGAITDTVKTVAKQLKVKPQQVCVNATTTTDGLLFKTPKGYYRAAYNSDGSAFVLEKLSLYHPQVTIQKER